MKHPLSYWLDRCFIFLQVCSKLSSALTGEADKRNFLVPSTFMYESTFCFTRAKSKIKEATIKHACNPRARTSDVCCYTKDKSQYASEHYLSLSWMLYIKCARAPFGGQIRGARFSTPYSLIVMYCFLEYGVVRSDPYHKGWCRGFSWWHGTPSPSKYVEYKWTRQRS